MGIAVALWFVFTLIKRVVPFPFPTLWKYFSQPVELQAEEWVSEGPECPAHTYCRQYRTTWGIKRPLRKWLDHDCCSGQFSMVQEARIADRDWHNMWLINVQWEQSPSASVWSDWTLMSLTQVQLCKFLITITMIRLTHRGTWAQSPVRSGLLSVGGEIINTCLYTAWWQLWQSSRLSSIQKKINLCFNTS